MIVSYHADNDQRLVELIIIILLHKKRGKSFIKTASYSKNMRKKNSLSRVGVSNYNTNNYNFTWQRKNKKQQKKTIQIEQILLYIYTCTRKIRPNVCPRLPDELTISPDRYPRGGNSREGQPFSIVPEIPSYKSFSPKRILSCNFSPRTTKNDPALNTRNGRNIYINSLSRAIRALETTTQRGKKTESCLGFLEIFLLLRYICP